MVWTAGAVVTDHIMIVGRRHNPDNSPLLGKIDASFGDQ